MWRIRHFLAVAEMGSVQAAARGLNLSQPALSKSLRLLEEHLHVTLFERSARGTVLTPMGQVFYRHARAIEMRWDSSLIELNAARSGARGELRIGIGPTYAGVFMRRILAKLSADYPNLSISVRTGVGTLLIPALQAGEISLYAGGLGTFPEGPGEGLEEVFLYDQSNCIVSARRHPLQDDPSSVCASKLASQPWVVLSYDVTALQRIEAFFRKNRLARPGTMLSTESLGLALDLVRHDGFLTSLPRPLVHPDINPELASLNVPGFDWTIRSGVTYRSSMRSLAPVRSILQELQRDVERLGFR